MMDGGLGGWHWGFGFGHWTVGVLMWTVIILVIAALIKFVGNKLGEDNGAYHTWIRTHSFTPTKVGKGEHA